MHDHCEFLYPLEITRSIMVNTTNDDMDKILDDIKELHLIDQRKQSISYECEFNQMMRIYISQKKREDGMPFVGRYVLVMCHVKNIKQRGKLKKNCKTITLSLPGGKRNLGEDSLSCGLRELEEETSIMLNDINYQNTNKVIDEVNAIFEMKIN